MGGVLEEEVKRAPRHRRLAPPGSGALARTLTGALLAALSGCGAEPASPTPTRVLLLSCDTLRADRLGVYGYEREVSPRLDALAADGAVFEAAYSTAPMTQPSVSSLMTGRLPEHIGVARGNLRRLPAEVETLAERLSREGVDTAAVISNWVLRRSPGASPGTSGGAESGVAQGFAHFDDRMEAREMNREAFERLAPDTTDAAIAWLERADLERPFFLWVHYQDPHGPYTPPRKLAQKFAQPPGNEPPLEAGRTVLGAGQLPSYQVLAGERRPSVYRDLYDAEIRYFDRELGRLLDWLDQRELLDTSYVLFTSDHGESLGEHDFWFCHGENVHREQVRVPLIVRAPLAGPAAGRGAPRGRIAAAASLIDVWPTVLEAFGFDPGPVPGRSLLQPLPDDRVAGQSLVPRGDHTRWWAVSDGRYRAVWNEQTPTPRLFDVLADPGEQRDLAAGDPERVERMLTSWQRVVDRGAATAVDLGRAIETRDDPATLEALRSLGYLNSDDESGD